MENWVIKNLDWIVPTTCSAHGSVLFFLIKWIKSKPGREEFDNRLKLMDEQNAARDRDIKELCRQNGKVIATLEALERSIKVGDEHIKELLDQLR